MVDVVVEYDYTALEPDELSIKKGDVIREVVKMKGGWWEGILNDKKGMFPDNFVREIDCGVSLRKKDVDKMRQCRVLFSYKQNHVDELELNLGDVIDLIGEEEEGWWRGMLNGKEGVFPSNFVEEIKSKPGSREDLTSINEVDKTPILPPKPAKLLCQVKYSYKAQNQDELTIKEGDVITLIAKDGQDPGWWKGELNGQVGVFPDNFVVILESEEKKPSADSFPFRGAVTVQRKSLDEKSVAIKKPAVPIKKSTSPSNQQGGILAGLRKKITDTSSSISKSTVSQSKFIESKVEVTDIERSFTVSEAKLAVSDVIDGNLMTKSQTQILKLVNEVKDEHKEENAFDHVERSSMLSDVRATRAKAPGRRPPSVVFKDGEPGVVNGNTDYAHLDSHSESSPSRPNSMHDQGELSEVKPRVREWEKHKAPWLEEMKLNQAKRTSPSPNNESSKFKLTPSDKSGSPDSDDSKSPLDKSTLLLDMSFTLTSANNSQKMSTHIEKNPVVLRHKNVQVSAPRPRTVNETQKTTSNNTSQNSKVSPSSAKQITSCKSPDLKATGDVSQDTVCIVHYMELLQRIEKLETLLAIQQEAHNATVEELKSKIFRLESQMHFN